MGLISRLARLERGAGVNSAPRCTHVITITREGEPVPKSRCDCDGTHINIIECPPKEAPYELRDET